MARVSNRYSTHKKSQLPLMKDLNSLALGDLKKIRKGYEAHTVKKEYFEAECARIDHQNRQATFQKDQWHKQHMEPVEAELKRIEQALRDCRTGPIGEMFKKNPKYNGLRYKHGQGEIWIYRHQTILEKKSAVLRSAPAFNFSSGRSMPRRPKAETNLKIGGATLKIDLSKIEVHELNILIHRHEENFENEKTKLMELQARAVTSEKKTRQQAQQFKRGLHKQLAKVLNCPYCSGQLNDSNAHLDHIYPVSKGGQSTPKNLVFVCAKCNLGKRTLTLRSFILEFGMNEAVVHERLELLNKDF